MELEPVLARAVPSPTATLTQPRRDGALLIRKEAGVSSFGVIEKLQKKWMQQSGLRYRDLPKMGHGGTLDPFATGLLAVCVGRAVKLARYFLGSTKGYEGVIRFGETTVPGDPTAPVSERSEVVPASIELLQDWATRLTGQPYLQTPPMHSAKKKGGRPLYELAREGIEVEREPKLCHLFEFTITEYQPPVARFRLVCSSGTYVRTLVQDYARMLGTVGLLEELNRTFTGGFDLKNALSLGEMDAALEAGQDWSELSCWMPFDELLLGYARAEATPAERDHLFQGRQHVLLPILARTALPDSRSASASVIVGQENCVALYCEGALIAIARQVEGTWGIERVFVSE
jgi:tRNA pseudouridine55 synthase